MRSAVLAAAAAMIPALAAAHDLWIERDADGFVLRQGHRGGELLAIDAARVKAIRCTDRSGGVRDVLPTARFGPREVRIPARCEAVSAFYHGGFYSLTPDGEVNLPRTQAAQAVKSWEARQFAKWVEPGAPGTRPLGDELEVVPVSGLSGKRVGDKVTLRVLSQGKPVAGAVVSVDHKPLGETDSAGEARIRLRSASVESVSASMRRPVRTAEADDLVLEASLTFEVAR